MSVDPKHILILGAGPGLGAAVARRFGREDFAVTLVARREAALAELAGEVRADGIVVETATADAADPPGFRAAMTGLARHVTPGVVVYNAALVIEDRILAIGEDALLETYAVNVLGAISAAQVFTPAMREAGAGTFLASSGYVGVEPQPSHASLSLGKAGLRGAVSLLHQELKPDGVHAAAIHIDGVIAPGTPLAPERIAEAYWDLHAQPAAKWTSETVFDGQSAERSLPGAG